MATDPLTRPLNELRDQLVAAAHRQAAQREVRPLDNIGRPYTLALGIRCLECGWWGYPTQWGERDDCPNCCADDADRSTESRWVRTDA